METELRNILNGIYKGQKENNDEAVEQILPLIKIGPCTLIIEGDDDWCSVPLTSCCKFGPIVNENYCPECGNKIKKDNAHISI